MSEISSPADTDAASSGLRDVLALLAGGKATIKAGDITVDDDGRLRVRKDADPIRFCFAYRGVDFDAQMNTSPDASISLSAELGKVPYSMETGSGRRLARKIVDATADLPGGRIDVSAAQDMSIVAVAEPPLPLTPASVMATITTLLLGLGPYIDLLRRVIESANGARTPAEAAATPDPDAAVAG